MAESGIVVSFAEETCWNGEDFRAFRKKVTFRVYSIGRNLGEKIEAEFEADYGLWWDQEDVVLLFHLNELRPDVNWRDMVFYKKMDQSGIDIFDPDTDRLVARIEVRAYEGRRLEFVNQELGVNVIPFHAAAAEVIKKRALSKGKDPSGETKTVRRDSGDQVDV